MIYYLTSSQNAALMQDFLDGFGSALARRIAVVNYQSLISGETARVPTGTYVFTSFGQSLGSRTPPSDERMRVHKLHAGLIRHLGPQRVLNDPARSLRRLDLLRALHAEGLNRFTAYRAIERHPDMHFPVFLRHELGTVWKAPPLVESREAFEAQVDGLKNEAVLAIEFCRTADANGVYRKYGCFVVGDRIVPRHLFFSRNWLVKSADIVDAAAVDEEMAYLSDNPHADVLRRVCKLANIGYGRIDYAVLDGVPQVWEINITPQIVNNPARDKPERQAAHAKFAESFCAALEALDPPPTRTHDARV